MAAVLSRCKTGFRANGLEWGASGVGDWVSVNPCGGLLRCRCSAACTPSTRHPTVYNRPQNWWVTAPSNSYAPSIRGFNQREKGKVRERDGKRQAMEGADTGRRHMFHYPYNHQSDCHTSNIRASYSSPRKFIAVWLWDSHQPVKYPWNAEPIWEQWKSMVPEIWNKTQ